jgi:Ca2+-binding RTX toxin-like protein
VIVGGAGNNRIYGGTGDDTIFSGSGQDLMTGEVGADVFAFNRVETLGIGTGRDGITDFEVGVDRIDLSALSMTFINSATFNGIAGELRLVPGFVIGDLDGDGAHDFAIGLKGVSGLTSDDFIL